MAYRTTPLAHGASPAELLMGRRLQSTVPVPPQTLRPKWPNLQAFNRTDTRLKDNQKKAHEARHRARELLILEPGQRVWIRSAKATGTIQAPSSTPRSYDVEPDSKVTVTRSGRISRPPERLDW